MAAPTQAPVAAAPEQDDDGTLRATAISCRTCQHGTVYIVLHGPDQAPFAYAPMEAERAMALLDDLIAATSTALAASGLPVGRG